MLSVLSLQKRWARLHLAPSEKHKIECFFYQVFLSDCEITKNSSKTETFLRLFLSIPDIFCIFVLIIAKGHPNWGVRKLK